MGSKKNNYGISVVIIVCYLLKGGTIIKHMESGKICGA